MIAAAIVFFLHSDSFASLGGGSRPIILDGNGVTAETEILLRSLRRLSHQGK
jgi:hypothetical protein